MHQVRLYWVRRIHMTQKVRERDGLGLPAPFRVRFTTLAGNYIYSINRSDVAFYEPN